MEEETMKHRTVRRGVALFAAMAVLLSGCAGRGSGSVQATEVPAAESQSDGTYPTIRVSLLVPTDAQKDLPMVEEALNTVTRRQIGAEVELVAVRMSDFSDIYIQMMAEDETLDLMLLAQGTNYLPIYVSNGLIEPLEPYLKSSGSYIAYMMGNGMEAGKYRDVQYGIPQETKRLAVYAKGFNLSRDICDRYGIDPAQIQTVEDLEAVFDYIHEKEPSLTVLMPEDNMTNIADSLIPYYDELTIGPGSLMEQDGEQSVACELEQKPVQDAIYTVRRWYEKGFIPQNVSTTDEYGAALLREGECFATASGTIGPEMGGVDYYSVVIVDGVPLETTDQEDSFVWVVSSQSKNPSLAVAFLDLCYRDSFVSNLLYYGVNGVHYEMNLDGTLELTSGTGYSNSWVQFGRISSLCFTTDDLEAATVTKGIRTVEKLQILYREWKTEKSAAYGFFFDPAEVELEIAACSDISEKYESLLKNGVVDPKTELGKYIQEMYEAGMRKILQEKERQLTEWMGQE